MINSYISKLQDVINFSNEDFLQLRQNLQNKDISDFIIVKKNLNWNELQAFELISNKFPFLFINKEKVRSYKDDYVFSHVLGYVGYRNDIKDPKVKKFKIWNFWS